MFSYVWSSLPMCFTLVFVFDSSNMVIIAIHVYCTSCIFILARYAYRTCIRVLFPLLYRYRLHRTAMLFDRENRKTRSHVSGFLKIRKPYKSLQTTVMYCSALFRIPIRILILIFKRTSVCPPHIEVDSDSIGKDVIE